MTFYGEVGETVDAGWISDARLCGQHLFKRRGFHLRQEEAHRHGKRHGNGKKPIRHVKETMDYSKANYNALELNVSDQPQTELTIAARR